MKYFIYSVAVLLLLQGCGSDSAIDTNTTGTSTSGNGEDLNAEPSTSTEPTPTENTEPSTPTEPTPVSIPVIDLPIVPTFERVGSDIVKETRSNLYWQDNEEAKTTIKNLPEAKEYCGSLTIDTLTAWRVPTYKELMTLVNYDRDKPAIYDDFSYTEDKPYWSSTTAASTIGGTGNSKSWAINFSTGNTGIDYDDVFATSQKHVRCVNDEFSNKRVADVNFTREDNIVTDHIYNLEWQDEVKTKVDKYDFTEAMAYCEGLDLNDKTDWKVPTMKELLSIHDVSDFDSATYNEFLYTAYNKPYRSSKERADIYGRTLRFSNGEIQNSGKTGSHLFDYYVRCVRDSGK